MGRRDIVDKLGIYDKVRTLATSLLKLVARGVWVICKLRREVKKRPACEEEEEEEATDVNYTNKNNVARLQSIIAIWDPGSQIRPKIQQLTPNNFSLKKVVDFYYVTSLQKLTESIPRLLLRVIFLRMCRHI